MQNDRPGAARSRLTLVGVLAMSMASVPAALAQQGGAQPAQGARRQPQVPANADTAFWKNVDLSPKPPVLPKAPAEEVKLIELQPGYRMTPILTDPQIEQPGQIAFDANGRMFVLELRSYMLDADARDELSPISRISRWEDRNNDGVYETGTVFVDGLVFPRFVMPLTDGVILTKESNADEVWKYTDTDGDGKADRKELFTTGFGRSGNVEHQEAALTWAMDNWMYSTYNTVRIRWTPAGVRREPIGSGGAQWGVSQDNYGKVWFQGGASGLPGYFQFPIVYGNFNYPQQLADGMRVPYGAPIGIADMQGGFKDTRYPDGSLRNTTAGAGANVYRGDRLPAELVGDYFYGEQVARILRRIRPTTTEGLTQVSNVYQPQQTEFIRSMDPLFRPVDNKTAPDGTIYIVDMYHGIIQEGTWSNPGSFLRAKIEQYDLDKVVRLGRIWRLTYDGMERDRTQPRMYQETAAQLVTHLSHPNGWWRDMAQQQLVLRQDRSVAPALKTMARSNPNQLARIHAIWTLEGLGSLDAALARELLKDRDPKVRIQAIRASESLYKAGDKSFGADWRELAADVEADVAIQAILTMNTLKAPEAESVIRAVQASNRALGVQFVATQILTPPPATNRGGGGGAPTRTAAEVALLERGGTVFRELCSQCHGDTGLGTPSGEGETMAPALAGNLRVTGHPDYVLRVLLHGMTGRVDGKAYEGQIMIPQGQQTDEWIAAVASYIRTSLTNNASMVTPEQVARVRAATASKSGTYTYDELMDAVPTLLPAQPTWKATASHSGRTSVQGWPNPANALTYEGWTTGEPQKAGMWFQLELPRAENLTSIQFSSTAARAGNNLPAGQVAPGAAPRPAGGGAAANAAPPVITYPRAYQVQLSTDGTTWSAPVAQGQGSGPNTLINFDPVRARFVRITQTADSQDAPAWTIQQLRLFTRQSAAAR